VEVVGENQAKGKRPEPYFQDPGAEGLGASVRLGGEQPEQPNRTQKKPKITGGFEVIQEHRTLPSQIRRIRRIVYDV
jgi:hypothetical protein